MRIHADLLAALVDSEIRTITGSDHVEGRVCILARAGLQVHLVTTTDPADFIAPTNPDHLVIVDSDDGIPLH